MSVDPTLGVTLEPMIEPPRLPTGNWLQDASGAMPQPLWVEQASEIPARLSPELTGGLFALVLGFPGKPWYGPREAGERLLELSGWSAQRTFRVSLAESTEPIEQGFLRRLRFWSSRATPTHDCSVAEVLQRFVTSETERVGEAEKWLRAKVGPKRPPGRLYDHLDYPVFDSGSGDLGFATLFHGPELHVWSRFIHHHK